MSNLIYNYRIDAVNSRETPNRPRLLASGMPIKKLAVVLFAVCLVENKFALLLCWHMQQQSVGRQTKNIIIFIHQQFYASQYSLHYHQTKVSFKFKLNVFSV